MIFRPPEAFGLELEAPKSPFSEKGPSENGHSSALIGTSATQPSGSGQGKAS